MEEFDEVDDEDMDPMGLKLGASSFCFLLADDLSSSVGLSFRVDVRFMAVFCKSGVVLEISEFWLDDDVVVIGDCRLTDWKGTNADDAPLLNAVFDALRALFIALVKTKQIKIFFFF